MGAMGRYLIAAPSLAVLFAACFGQTLSKPVPPHLMWEATIAPYEVVAESATRIMGPRASSSKSVDIVAPTPVHQTEPTFSPALTILPTVEVATGTATPFADPLNKKLDAVGLRANIVRELSTKNPVKRFFVSRDEMSFKVAEILKEDKDEISIEQKLLTSLGLLSNEDALGDLILALYSEGILGLYDSEEQKFFVVQNDDGLNPSQERTYVHEFVHHLQQQAFDIDTTIKNLEYNQDAELAFRALVEGDASLAEGMYVQRYMSGIERAASQEKASNALMDAFYAAPRTVQRSFIFPYVEGLQFVKQLYSIGGWDSVNQSFSKIPQSTEQVIHPEKYLLPDDPIAVKVPSLIEALGDGWSELTRNTMGELFLLAFLESGLSPEFASIATAGWGGDHFVLLEGPGEGDNLFAALIIWDTEKDAKEFFDAITVASPVIFSKLITSDHTGALWERVGEEGLEMFMVLSDRVVSISLESEKTVLVIGPNVTVLEIVQRQFVLKGFVGF